MTDHPDFAKITDRIVLEINLKTVWNTGKATESMLKIVTITLLMYQKPPSDLSYSSRNVYQTLSCIIICLK